MVTHVDEFPKEYFTDGPLAYDYVIKTIPGWYESLDEFNHFLLDQETEIVGLRLFSNA